MKKEKDYVRDIAEIRSMMERSSKFLSLSGWAGIMAGLYALAGTYVAFAVLEFEPEAIFSESSDGFSDYSEILLLGILVLLLALGTAIFLSLRKARRRGEKLWNPTAKRLVTGVAVPLLAGGLLILIMIAKGLGSLILPFSLLFYGLALLNAAKYTYSEVRAVGLIEVVLGLLSCIWIDWALWFWAAGFGLVHIIYGIYMYYRYER